MLLPLGRLLAAESMSHEAAAAVAYSYQSGGRVSRELFVALAREPKGRPADLAKLAQAFAGATLRGLRAFEGLKRWHGLRGVGAAWAGEALPKLVRQAARRIEEFKAKDSRRNLSSDLISMRHVAVKNAAMYIIYIYIIIL